MFYKNELPWAIQKMAADGAGGGAGAEEGTGDATDTNQNDGNESQGVSFDDFLKDKANQAEFDRRVAKALETQKGKLDKDYADKLAAQKTEAEKLARMNAEQKAEYERQKHEDELAKREADITRRELRAEALNQLGEKKLPQKLADILDYSSADACTKSIESVTAAFQEAVAEGVAAATKGGKPPKAAPDGGRIYSREELESMSPEEINANWPAVQESLKA